MSGPAEIDTGVTNGDVDWLFRGKSKKLTKRLNPESRVPDPKDTNEEKGTDSERSEKEKAVNEVNGDKDNSRRIDATTSGGVGSAKDSITATNSGERNGSGRSGERGTAISATAAATTSTGTTNDGPNTSRPTLKTGGNEPPVGALPQKMLQTQPQSETAGLVQNQSAAKHASQHNPQSGPQLPSKASQSTDKSGSGTSGKLPTADPRSRARLASAPQQPEPKAQQKRRTSMNFISVAAGGAPADADARAKPLPAVVCGGPPAASSATAASPTSPASGLQSQGSVSRSNSGRRSFFSSLSLKFKLSVSAPGSASASASPTLSPATSKAPGPKQTDLAAAVTRPPPEIRTKSTKTETKGGFFRRRALVDPDTAITPSVRVVLNRNRSRPAGTVSLRRVAFALDKLDDDPQQQIPSRRPRKGNVLVPEDLTAPVPRLAQGISASDGRTPVPEPRYTEKELQMAVEAQQRALLEADKHAMEAHLLAKKLAVQLALNKPFGRADEAEPEPAAERIEIDMPVHLHEHHFGEEPTGPGASAPGGSGDAPDAGNLLGDAHSHGHDPLDDSPLLETLYTRCCHLREILPIPATLKQLKNKTRPLQVLKLLNPRPTLIDVLSFSDFVAITPINTVIFDNVAMSTEMLKHLLAALVHNRYLEKLSLRNVAMDDVGWLYLCEFLARNTAVRKLDISQQRVKQVTKHTSFRSAMNWDAFIASLVARGGIEELVMGGCKLADDTFQNLLHNALAIATCRLGMAATEINVRKCELVAEWIGRDDSKCVGIDVAYNDLSQGQLRPFINTFMHRPVKLIFFSLSSTNLSNADEVGELLRGLANVRTLRFLDLSSLPQLFPNVISKLSKYLPLFPCLKRIHMDLNDLTSESIEAICDILPRVDGLIHVSLLGNRSLDRRSIVAIYTAVKMSAIFTLDLDYDLVPDDLSQRLALYLMRNMDRTIRPDITNISGDTEQDDVMFDGSLLMERAEKMLIESDKSAKPGETDYKVQKIITNALIERTNAVRKDIHKIIDSLFERRTDGALTFEEKENLLRFCLLDASLEKVVHLFEQKAQMFSMPLSPSPSVNSPQTPALPTDHDQLHESSSALIAAGPILMGLNSRAQLPVPVLAPTLDQTFEPHSVVVDAASDGLNVPIDNLTGRPVLMKSVSQTSVHAKEQELEEGEFHRWGYFMEHRTSTAELNEETKPLPVLGAVPSGSELREAIIDAKGIDSVTQLITKINDNRVSLDKIYNVDGLDAQHFVKEDSSPDTMRPREVFEDAPEKLSDADDAASIDSSEDHAVHSVVNEAYDKLLNEAQRVRSNK